MKKNRMNETVCHAPSSSGELMATYLASARQRLGWAEAERLGHALQCACGMAWIEGYRKGLQSAADGMSNEPTKQIMA